MNDAPEFTSEPLTDATAGESYSYDITAYDIDGDVLTFEAKQTPSWLTLDSNGDSSAVLSGTPENEHAGDHNVTITVTDNHVEQPVQQEFTITVEGATNLNDPVFADQITIYPNPASGTFNLAGLSKGAKIVVTNMAGVKLVEKEVRESPVKVKLNPQPAGVSTVQSTANGKTATFRMVIE